VNPGAFLSLLWGAEPPGLIQVWELHGKRSSYYRAPAGTAVLANRVDVYTGVSLTHKDHGRNHRGRSDQASAIAGLWLDIDINGGPDNKTGAAPDIETAFAIATAYANPTITVYSGYGIHVWYLFDQPWRFTSREDQDHAALASAQWFALHRTEAARYGAGIDHAHDLARLLRLPGTYNAKGIRKGEDPDGAPVTASHVTTKFRREQLLEIAAQAGDVPVRGGQKPGLGDQPDIKARPTGPAIPIKVQALIDNVPEFAATWHHQLGRRAASWSMSEYDLSLTGQAAHAGLTDQDLADLIVHHRHHWDPAGQKASRLDYLQRTIAKARTETRRDVAADQLEALRRAA